MPRTRSRGWRTGVTAGLAVVALALTACTADPPPPIEQAEPTTTPPPEPLRSTVVVAVDDIGNGFNPHLLADRSPVANAVAKQVLPSAFRAVPDPEDPRATVWVPDESLLVSAGPSPDDPLTIVYRLRDEAQWSDGAPIAAEDFRYLWRQMVTQPGVVDPAGYRLIEDIASSGGGKTVTVTFREPYPAWRELFADMLPAHLVKDTPGGFATGLAETVPVSGGRFSVENVDRGRGEILLERNDRFWGTPAGPDEILIRRGGSDAQLTESMRSHDAQVVHSRGGIALEAQLAAVPGLRTGVQLQPRTLELTLNARTPELSDPRVRRGLLDLLDPQLLALVAAGNETGVVPNRAQVFAPSDPGYVETMPPRLDREQALGLLAEAGYLPAPVPPVSESPPSSDSAPAPAPSTTEIPEDTEAPEAVPVDELLDGGIPRLVRDGKPLTLVVGVPEEAGITRVVARTAVDVWRGAGIDATVTELPAEELYGEALVEGRIHAIVGWMEAGADPATVAMSRFGCVPDDPASSAGEDPDAPPVTGETTTTTTSVTTESDADPDAAEVREEAAAAQSASPSNLSGACVPELEERFAAALTGAEPAQEILVEAQPQLWDLAVNLPVLQDRAVVAAGPTVEGVPLTAAVSSGIVGTAHLWGRTTP